MLRQEDIDYLVHLTAGCGSAFILMMEWLV
jgi:hypothetical protein